MKKLAIILLSVGSAFAASAQIINPVRFDYKATKTGSATYAVHVTAVMSDGWHIYAQVQPKEAIATPTEIMFNKNPLVNWMGKPKEIGEKEKYVDKTAGIIQYQYGHTLDFVQNVKLKSVVKTEISGTVTYQACTDKMCLPPKTVPFTIALQ